MHYSEKYKKEIKELMKELKDTKSVLETTKTSLLTSERNYRKVENERNWMTVAWVGMTIAFVVSFF